MRNHGLLTIGFVTIWFIASAQHFPSFDPNMRIVQDIPIPEGYERIKPTAGSFAGYLTKLPLRKDRIVYLFNGTPKTNQALHYAVIDISTGTKDLQQCADLVMRFRAEYFLARKQYDSIRFKGAQTVYRYADARKTCNGDERACFTRFMEKVFANCGTYQLEAALKKVQDIRDMQIGDIFIKAGAPGHAEIVIDMAIHTRTHQKIFLLAEGYMPAQDAHIVLNALSSSLGPWYVLKEDDQIITATWPFTKHQLRRY